MISTLARRIALSVVGLVAAGGIAVAGASAAHADVSIGGWNNGDGTSTVYRVVTDDNGNVVEVAVAIVEN